MRSMSAGHQQTLSPSHGHLVVIWGAALDSVWDSSWVARCMNMHGKMHEQGWGAPPTVAFRVDCWQQPIIITSQRTAAAADNK
jgi:hypothetical protein